MLPLVLTVFLWVAVMFPSPASAAFIGLNAPVTGAHAPGDLVALTVTFDPNGSEATNVVLMDLYVAFTGLTPVGYQLGDLFTPFSADPAFFAMNGVCADLLTCMFPEGSQDSAQHYEAFASVPTPWAPAGPGTLFTLQFEVSPGNGGWSLNLFGDSDFSLLWDPTPDQICDFEDPACDPSVPPIPFALTLPDDMVPPGLARINVGIDAPGPQEPPDPTVVPEPATLLMFGSGLLALVGRERRRRRRP